MIRFALKCNKSHQFEAWFRGGDDYERQAKRGLIRCPDCGSQKVGKAIMAPAIGRHRGGHSAPAAPAAPAVPAPAAPAAADNSAMHVAGKMHEMLREMRRFIETNAEHVGPRFADEARKMHRGEAAERSIYGEASDQEAETLREEGIKFGQIPWPKYKHDA